GLLNIAIQLARQSLSKNGTFAPFGAHISADGETALVEPDEVNPDAVPELLSGLRELLREKAQNGEIRAAVLCFEGRATPPGEDAACAVIGLQLDHESGECYELGVPYVIADTGEVELGMVFGARVQPDLFATT
ncbi:MAG: hypothetical protein IRY96_07460, partial [Burkholderiales bacterium]|nr:hypothetical protein [Burkholderiales bacterium]